MSGSETFASGHGPVSGGWHLLHFYPDTRELATTLAWYATSTLSAGGVVASYLDAGHRRAFEAELRRAGIDPESAQAGLSYRTGDPEEIMRRIIIDGEFDDAAVDEMRGALAELARQTAGPLLIFGEVSFLLWRAGMVDLALELEARTDRIMEDNLTVVCVYPYDAKYDLAALSTLCGRHSYLTSLPGELADQHDHGIW